MEDGQAVRYREYLEDKFILSPLKRLIEKGQYPGQPPANSNPDEFRKIAEQFADEMLNGEIDEQMVIDFLTPWHRKADDYGFIVNFEALQEFCRDNHINLYRLIDDVILKYYQSYEYSGDGIRITTRF